MAGKKEALVQQRMSIARLFQVLWIVAIVGLAGGVGVTSSGDSSSDPTSSESTDNASPIQDGMFTSEQVEQGMSVISANCATCHGSELGGSANAPPLKGIGFDFFWEGKTLAEMFEFVRSNMPPTSPGTLRDEQYLHAVVAILAQNGLQPGEQTLPMDLEVLNGITYVAPEE